MSKTVTSQKGWRRTPIEIESFIFRNEKRIIVPFTTFLSLSLSADLRVDKEEFFFSSAIQRIKVA